MGKQGKQNISQETKRSRAFSIVQSETNPKDGTDLGFNEETILASLDKSRMIKSWAYVRHDKDQYTAEEVAEQRKLEEEGESEPKPWVSEGALKPTHWHVVIWVPDKMPLGRVADLFGVPPFLVKSITGGQRGFRDSVCYLTHEQPTQQDKGKALYSPEDVKHDPSLDYATLSRDAQIEAIARAKNMSVADYVVYVGVGKNGVHPKEIRRDYPEVYAKRKSQIEKQRAQYIKDVMPVPEQRMNFYIEVRGEEAAWGGEHNDSVDQVAEALRRALYPSLASAEALYDMMPQPGSEKSYDGQPIVLWRVANSAFSNLRATFFERERAPFLMYPESCREPRGRIAPHAINLFDGEYNPRKYSWLPEGFIIRVEPKGRGGRIELSWCAEPDKTIAAVVNRLDEIAGRTAGNEPMRNELMAASVAPLIEAAKSYVADAGDDAVRQYSDEELRDHFSDIGKPLPLD